MVATARSGSGADRAAAGALRQLDPSITRRRRLGFFAFAIEPGLSALGDASLLRVVLERRVGSLQLPEPIRIVAAATGLDTTDLAELFEDLPQLVAEDMLRTKRDAIAAALDPITAMRAET